MSFANIIDEGNSRSYSGDTTFGIEEAIEDADNLATFNVDLEEVSNEISSINDGIKITEAASDVVTVEEMVLSNGTVNKDVAKVAYANTKLVYGMLGYDTRSLNVSHESIDDSPTTALKVSSEDLKDKLKSGIEKVKAWFAKIWLKIRGMFSKLVLAVSNYEKKFEKLEEKAKEISSTLKKDDDTASDSDRKKIITKFGAVLVDDGNTIDEKNLDKIVSKFKKVCSKTEMKKLLEDYTSKAKEVMTDSTKKGTQDNTFIANFEKAFDGVKGLLGNDGAFLENHVLIRRDGTLMRGVVIITEEVDKPVGNLKFVKVTAKQFKATLRKDIIKKGIKKLDIPPRTFADDVISAGKEVTKDFNSYKSYMEGIGKDMETDLKNITVKSSLTGDDAKKDEDWTKTHIENSAATFASTTAFLTTESMAGYISQCQNLLWLASFILSKYKSNED